MQKSGDSRPAIQKSQNNAIHSNPQKSKSGDSRPAIQKSQIDVRIVTDTMPYTQISRKARKQ